MLLIVEMSLIIRATRGGYVWMFEKKMELQRKSFEGFLTTREVRIYRPEHECVLLRHPDWPLVFSCDESFNLWDI
jgi:hypothetical protein